MKPSIPKGTRDFSPIEMGRRNYIFDTIKQVFQRYGFLPIETPAMENLATLTGKYGDEGDQLIFKVLNSGDFLKDVDSTKLSEKNSKQVLPGISEKALRYDLTVPFARYVVQHQNEITFPFKRYQMQPVWRADRPQKGRYREFYQCDADVIGSNSLLNEIELTQLIDDVFSKLKLPVVIKINNRKILSGIAEVIGEEKRMMDIVVAIDKIDKIGPEGVYKELVAKNIPESSISKMQGILMFHGDNPLVLETLKGFLVNSSIGMKGVEELESIVKTSNSHLSMAELKIDISLARGLNYYTGAIFEVKSNAGTLVSSICGGGRYDNLTGIFGLPNVSGVGISFGVDRIYDVMEELNLFSETAITSTKLLFVNFGEAEQTYCLPLLSKVRAAGINAEIYPDQTKVKKQFDYANKKSIPYVVVVGSDEMASGQLTFKNMSSGEQEKLTVEKIIERLK